MALKNRSVIKFNYQIDDFKIGDSLYFKTFLASVMAQEGIEFSEIQYVFCTDEYLIKLNQRYLQHDTYTDILTFTLSLPNEPIVSEIYISIERVQENALIIKVPFMEELSRVMIHGLLHLSGYNDGTDEEKKEMRKKEDHYLKQLSL